MTPEDQLSASILSRIQALEFILKIILDQSSNRESIKAQCLAMAEAFETSALTSQASDLENAISQAARIQTIYAVFPELEPKT